MNITLNRVPDAWEMEFTFQNLNGNKIHLATVKYNNQHEFYEAVFDLETNHVVYYSRFHSLLTDVRHFHRMLIEGMK